MGEDRKIVKYTYFKALINAVICTAAALGVNYLIMLEVVTHDFEALFAPVLVGVLLAILNFSVLSKLSIILLPPVFGVLGIAPVLGVFGLAQLGFEAKDLGEMLSVFVQTFPVLVVASFLYRWYAGLASSRSTITYFLIAIGSVVFGLLVFKDNFPFELSMAAYLGYIALLLNRLHVGVVLR